MAQSTTQTRQAALHLIRPALQGGAGAPAAFHLLPLRLAAATGRFRPACAVWADRIRVQYVEGVDCADGMKPPGAKPEQGGGGQRLSTAERLERRAAGLLCGIGVGRLRRRSAVGRADPRPRHT